MHPLDDYSEFRVYILDLPSDRHCLYAPSDLTPLSGLAALEALYLSEKNVEDLAPLSGLTALQYLSLYENSISDLTPLSGLTTLTSLSLGDNSVSDLTPLSRLTTLDYLGLEGNLISDLSPLLTNTGLDAGDHVRLWRNPFDCAAEAGNIQALENRGAHVYTDCP